MAQLQVKKGATKALPSGGNTKFTGGLGWDAVPGGDKVDLDVWVLRHRSGAAEPDIISWANEALARPDLGQNSEGNPYIATPELDVIHQGDDRTGAGSATGYDEIIVLDPSKAPADTVKYDIIVTYYEDPDTGSGMTLGMATSIVCGFKDETSGHELKAPIEENHGFDVTAHVVTIAKTDSGQWTLTNIDQGYSENVFDVLRQHFGVAV